MFKLLFNKIEDINIKINKIYEIISLGMIIPNTENKERDILYLQKMKNIVLKIEEKLHSTFYRLVVKDDELNKMIGVLENYDKQLTSFNNKCPMCLNRFNYHNKEKYFNN